MAKNLMPRIAEMLGVELGEEFKLKGLRSRWIYKFTEHSFLCKLDDFRWESAFNVLEDILHGDIEIEKLPWEPKYEERYYTIAMTNYTNPYITWARWRGCAKDYALRKLEMIYKTEDEAKAHMSEDYQRLTGKSLDSH